MSVVFFDEAWAFVEIVATISFLATASVLLLKPDIFRRKQLLRRNLRITNEIVSNRMCAGEQ